VTRNAQSTEHIPTLSVGTCRRTTRRFASHQVIGLSSHRVERRRESTTHRACGMRQEAQSTSRRYRSGLADAQRGASRVIKFSSRKLKETQPSGISFSDCDQLPTVALHKVRKSLSSSTVSC